MKIYLTHTHTSKNVILVIHKVLVDGNFKLLKIYLINAYLWLSIKLDQ